MFKNFYKYYAGPVFFIVAVMGVVIFTMTMGFSAPPKKKVAARVSHAKPIKHVTSTTVTTVKQYNCDYDCQQKNDVMLKSGADYTDYFTHEDGKEAQFTIFHNIPFGDKKCEIYAGVHADQVICP